MSARQPLLRATARGDWLDYNGHLNEAYYLLIFSWATDALMDAVGLDEAGRARHGASLFTLETHLCYLAEIAGDAGLEVDVRILASDAKRLHLFHELRRSADGVLAATAEMVLICVDLRSRRTTPFPPATMALIEARQRERAGEPWPERAGRAVALRAASAKPHPRPPPL